MVKLIDKVRNDLNNRMINHPNSGGIRYDGNFNKVQLSLYSNNAIRDSYLILKIVNPDNHEVYLSSVGIDSINDVVRKRYLKDLDIVLVNKLTVDSKLDSFFNKLTDIVRRTPSNADNLDFNMPNINNEYAPFIQGIKNMQISWDYLNFIKSTIGIDNNKLLSLRKNNLTFNGTRNPNKALSKHEIIVQIDDHI